MSWKDDLNYLKAARQEREEYSPMMSEYERHVIREDIKARQAAAWPGIAQGAIDTFHRATAKYKEADGKVKAVKSKEASKWDNGKLAAEMAGIKGLVELEMSRPLNILSGDVGHSERLAAIYQDSKSGDPHKARAAAEVFAAFDPGKLPQGDRFPGAQLKSLAEMDLKELRHPEGIEQAEAAKAEALQGIQEAAGLVKDASIACGQGDPSDPFIPTSSLAPLLRSVRRGADGELEFLAEDSPEVTGIYPIQEV
jgi:hypothetical protein